MYTLRNKCLITSLYCVKHVAGTAVFIDTDKDEIDDTGELEHVHGAERRQNFDVDE